MHSRSTRSFALSAALAVLALAATSPAAAAARPAVTAAQADDDPETVRANFLARLEGSLKRHPFFSQVGYQRVDDYPPFVLYVQNPPRVRSGYVQGQARFFGPFLKKLEEVFREQYAAPAGVEATGAVPVYAIAVLNSEGAYQNYMSSVRGGGHGARAHYEPRLKLAVTYKDLFGPASGADHTERQPILHELVHALQHAYHAKREMTSVAWFNEGLADYLAMHRGRTPQRLDEHLIESGRLIPTYQVLRGEGDRRIVLSPLAELIRYGSYEDVFAGAARRSQAAGFLVDSQSVLSAFYGQSYLMMHYLHQGAEGRHKDATVEFVGRVLAGEEGEPAFRRAFADVELDELDSGFTEYVEKAWRDYLETRGVDMSAATEAAEAEMPEEAVATAPVDLAGLALRPDEAEARLAVALCQVLDGDEDAAHTELTALAALDGESELRARIGLELARLDAYVAMRDRYAKAVEAKGRKLDAATPVDVIAAVGSKIKTYGPAWVRLYPYALANNEKTDKLLRKDKSEEVAALRADRTGFYRTTLPLGRAAQALASLADAGTERLATIESLSSTHGELEVVKSRKPLLQAIAREALTAEVAASGVSELVRAEVSDQGNGVVRLTYDFKDRGQLADFVRDDEYMTLLSAGRSALSLIDGTSGFELKSGALVGLGSACLRHTLRFRSPMTARYTVTWVERAGYPQNQLMFAMGICGDGESKFISSQGSGSLLVFNPGRSTGQPVQVHDSIVIGTTYRFELRHDGKERVDVLRNDERKATSSTDGLKSGDVFLRIHSEFLVQISHLEIEGQVDENALRGARRAWVDARLARLGLD